MPPLVPRGRPWDGISCSLKDEDMFNERTLIEGGVDDGLCGDCLSTATALVGGDEDT